jgi:hypothetical protein
MKLGQKKILPWAATSLIAFTNFAYADGDNAQMRNLENRVAALEQRKGGSGMINPQGRPQIKDGADLFLDADLIYWNAHENGLQVAVENEGSSHNLSDSEAKTLHGKWNVGFRAGIGYNTPHDGWDLRLTWLRFTDNGHKRAHVDNDDAIYPTRLHPAQISSLPGALSLPFSDAATKFKSAWHLRLNQLDLDLGREFFVSKWLTLRPHFGLRTDWIRQSLEADYKNFENQPLPNQTEAELKDRWWGMGLEGGLDTQWGLGGGWSIFGDISAAIIYGFHHMKYETEDETTEVEFVDMAYRYRISHPILDLEMGLRWDNMFSNDRFHLGLQVGWEHHIYFSQNQFPIFVDDISLGSFVQNQGDLTLQGWTFSARFDF